MRDLTAWNGEGLPPPGPAINDPELKKMTATVANGNPGLMNVFVIYSDADNNGGGLVRLWLDQSKTNQINLTHNGNGVYQAGLLASDVGESCEQVSIIHLCFSRAGLRTTI